ncbi:964_t:CDS:2 [Entrophospora sp. SA101]|nr:964_t:CDS:2 [Entrophospora sp. SA101]
MDGINNTVKIFNGKDVCTVTTIEWQKLQSKSQESKKIGLSIDLFMCHGSYKKVALWLLERLSQAIRANEALDPMEAIWISNAMVGGIIWAQNDWKGYGRHKSISLIMDEIIRTNRELRKQLAEDDEIISKYETRIKSLVRDLENSNLEIHYLDKSLIQREAEIETLKEDNKNLSIQLRKALQDIDSKENFIVFREDQFIALEDKISTFNKKPKMSSTRQIQPPNPNEIDVSTDNIAKWNDDQLEPLQAQLQQNLQAFNQVNIQLTQAQRDLNQLHQDYLQLNVAHTQLNNTHTQFVNAQTQFINNTHNPLVQANHQLIQAYNFKHGQLQIFQQKYVKWKQRTKNPDVIWLVGFSN